tara:strand:- start:760 stop:3258 length:2499 start_codon:yes stop_codon:yes gene_type:complete
MKQICFLFLFLSLSLQAQYQVNGLVTAATDRKPLAFASVIADNGTKTITDVDGKFTLNSKKNISSFSVSYIGFLKTTIKTVGDKRLYYVVLNEKSDNLKEVIIPNDNPALAIIKKTIAKKGTNNPTAVLKSFDFTSYNKLIVTANPETFAGTIDSVFVKKGETDIFSKVDSTNFKFKELISKRHLFQTEKVSQYQFDGTKLKETILGTKMAGFKQPIYEILSFNLQSFSVYDNNYELFETKYKSPIADGATNDYNYKILDTIAIDGRLSYMIYFKNKKQRKAAGLEGILYIDKNNYAIAKAIMRIKGVLDISGTHDFEYIPAQDLWFPKRKTFKIVKGKNDDDIKILGGTVQFDGDIDKDFQTRKRQPSDFVYLLSETNNVAISYNKAVVLDNKFIAVELQKEAINKPELFWETYRKDSLDSRNNSTYIALDSIGGQKRIVNRIRLGRKIINGYLPVAFFDIDLRKIFTYNNYEGFRLGFGGVTNDRFSKYLKISGYTGYGTKDGTFKYSAGTAVNLSTNTNTWLNVSYTNDVREIGTTLFSVDKRPYKIYDPRPINISTFYNYTSWRTFLETKIIPKTDSFLELSTAEIEPKFNYIYNLDGKLYAKYTMTTALISLQWNPFSDFMQTPTGRVEVEKRFPKFTLQFTQSLPKVLENDFTFSKIDFKTEYEKKYLNGHKTNLLFQAGYATGDIPLTHLYNTSPNNITKETIIQRMTFASKNSFETMYFNEFFSNEFVYFQLKHGFKRVTILKKVKPTLVLVSRMGWGNLRNPEQHVGLDYKTLDRGYFESGIELNQIFNGLGLTGFYRYGPNQLPKFEDNIAIKLSFILNLGI